MAHLSSPGPYLIVELDSSVQVRLIGPGLRQYDQLSNALSRLARKLKRRGDFTNLVTSFLWALAEARRLLPDPAAAMESGYYDALNVQHQFLNAIKATTTEDPHTDAVWVKGSSKADAMRQKQRDLVQQRVDVLKSLVLEADLRRTALVPAD